jgi:Icc-related predicted phosphoesterase
LRFVCISDTHCQIHKIKIPNGDILIHTGDLTFRGNIVEISKELRALEKLKSRFAHIIVTPGNHDWLFERNFSLAQEMCAKAGVTLLLDSSVTIDSIKIYGSPWQPEFMSWAFNLPRGEKLKDRWDLIPADTDILITHSPPHGVLDEVKRVEYYPAQSSGKSRFIERVEHVGCEELMKAVGRIKPAYHVFGHIHAQYGQFQYEQLIGRTNFINASNCTEEYDPINIPIVFDYSK